MAMIRAYEDSSYYFIAEIEDINNRIEAEKKYQNLVDQSLVGVYIFQDGRFVYVNPALVEESGYTEEEMGFSSACGTQGWFHSAR
jgi:PAS domain-containing protein